MEWKQSLNAQSARAVSCNNRGTSKIIEVLILPKVESRKQRANCANPCLTLRNEESWNVNDKWWRVESVKWKANPQMFYLRKRLLLGAVQQESDNCQAGSEVKKSNSFNRLRSNLIIQQFRRCDGLNCSRAEIVYQYFVPFIYQPSIYLSHTAKWYFTFS